jgi:hypothetical protein
VARKGGFSLADLKDESRVPLSGSGAVEKEPYQGMPSGMPYRRNFREPASAAGFVLAGVAAEAVRISRRLAASLKRCPDTNRSSKLHHYLTSALS